jgi:membrane-bound lytic murein transglycosylase B
MMNFFKTALFITIMIGVIWTTVWPKSSSHETDQAQAAPARTAVTKNPNGRDLGKSVELVRAVSETYEVPAGLLYGIWQVESGGLASGFGADWQRAPDLVAAGSRCVRQYGESRCQGWWTGLRAVCSQLRNGRPVCDPNEVRTSYAYAMGPMQLLPSSVLTVRPDGSTVWTSNAVDFDGDGVVDPHSLPDAMAMAARHVRFNYEQKAPSADPNDAWIWAANRYYGSQTAGYYEGTTKGRRGIQDYWREWCEKISPCTGGQMLASN